MISPHLRELDLPRHMAVQVRMIAALELRDEGLPGGDEASHNEQRARKDYLLGATRDFFVGSEGLATDCRMIAHARERLGDIDTIRNGMVQRRFRRIAEALDHYAREHCGGSSDSERRRSAEIEEIFDLLNRYALLQYRTINSGFSPPDVWLETHFHQENDEYELMDATAISGATTFVDQPPENGSVITLGVRDHGLDWRSLCHLPYTLMHELICHAYQGVGGPGREPVYASCSWTEGWMDALAASEIELWLQSHRDRKPDWVERNSNAIKSGTALLSQRRYQRPTMLASYVLDQRVAAREGFRTLFEAYKGADRRSDKALERTARFSLTLNLEPMTRDDRQSLVARLVANLESWFGLRLSDLLEACSRYALDGNLPAFLARLKELDP